MNRAKNFFVVFPLEMRTWFSIYGNVKPSYRNLSRLLGAIL